MSDIFDRAKRSEIMARIRSRGNSATELRLIKLLREHRIRGWRRNYPLFGKPDLVFPTARLAVFIDGEFWHGHPAEKLPMANKEFWESKIARNKKRDRLVNRVLKGRGWRILRIWQHELTRANQRSCMKKIQRIVAAKADCE